MFYDDSILSGTKTALLEASDEDMFYYDSILSGTKTHYHLLYVLFLFYDDSILSGTKTSNTTFCIKIKHMYLSFA